MTDLKTRLRTLKEYLHRAGTVDGKYLSDIDLAISRISVLESEIERLKARQNKETS